MATQDEPARTVKNPFLAGRISEKGIELDRIYNSGNRGSGSGEPGEEEQHQGQRRRRRYQQRDEEEKEESSVQSDPPPARRSSLLGTAAAMFQPISGVDLTPELVADPVKAKLAFTKYPTYNFQEFFGAKEFGRVGVPGSFTYDYSSVWTLTIFIGSSFQAVLLSSSFYIHVLLFLVMVAFNTYSHSPSLLGSSIDSVTLGAITSVTTFTLVFFTGRVYTRFNERFHDVCRTNGGMTVVSALCAGYLSQTQRSRARGVSVMRYTNAILNIYYMQISGPMDAKKWESLKAKGILTKAEVRHVSAHGSPGVLIYSWAARLLQRAVNDGELNPMQADRIEQNISIVRGLAAKQIAYTLTQVPLVYFHILSMCVHSFLLAYSWKASVQFYLQSHRECGYPDDDGLSQIKMCYSGAATMCIVGQIWLIYLFVGLYMASVWMSDPMGTQSSNYDLQVDLDGLWQESLNAASGSLLHEVDVPEPEVVKQPMEDSFTVEDCPMINREL